jgi:hypothetical protein
MCNIRKRNVAISSFSEEQFIDLLKELQRFLKTKLTPCENDEGIIHYWTCGVDHFEPPIHYDPLKNFKKFCTKRHLDWRELKERVEEYSGMSIHCECLMVNYTPLRDA